MKCSVDGCTKNAKHNMKIQANTLVGVQNMNAHLCDEHKSAIVTGTSQRYSMGCSYGAEDGDRKRYNANSTS